MDAALVATAPMLFVLFWGSGFPITRFGLEYTEPFTLLAIRSALNVALVLAIVPFVRVRWPQPLARCGAYRGVGLPAAVRLSRGHVHRARRRRQPGGRGAGRRHAAAA